MLDIKLLRERSDIVINDLKKRGDAEKEKWVPEFLKLDGQRRKMLFKIEQDRKARNAISIEIARMRKEGKDISFNKESMADLGKKIAQNEAKLAKLEEKLMFYLYRFPNILHESVPRGASDADNKVVRTWGSKPDFAFKPRSHIELMEQLGLADLDRAGKISGSRFYFIKNELALMDSALMRLASEHMMKAGFTPVIPPYLMRRKPYEGVTDLGDFEDVMYKVDGEDLYMIATSEHPLVAMHMDEKIPEDTLPIRYAGFSANFRKEAGTHGALDKGIFRVHQFNKAEMLVLSKPEDSWAEHERLMKIAEKIFQAIELPYRIVSVCTGDIGTVAAKKYDLEVWFPSQKRYREAVSGSNCTDYQARRLGIKYGRKDEKPKGLVHTLNCTAIATVRPMAAILENFQRKDGTVLVPKRLREHMGGIKKIVPKP
jgi:seryl-tRNA synthetase